MDKDRVTVLISCQHQKGIIANVSNWFYERGLNILHCQQYASKDESPIFFMRIEADMSESKLDKAEIEEQFCVFASQMKLSYKLFYASVKQRLAILVSKTSHCLYELLSRYEENDLICDIAMIIGNHDSLCDVAKKFNIPFY